MLATSLSTGNSCTCQKPSDKSQSARQTAEHEPAHGDVDHRLARAAEQLVVLAQPARLGLPRERALDDPAARKHPKAGWQPAILGPVDLLWRDVVGRPDLLVARWMRDDLGAPAQRRLDPLLALAAPVIAGVE